MNEENKHDKENQHDQEVEPNMPGDLKLGQTKSNRTERDDEHEQRKIRYIVIKTWKKLSLKL